MSLWPLIEPGAKEWSDEIHAANVAYAKEHEFSEPRSPAIDSVALCSQAISLKRIADALDRLSPVRGPRWPNLLTPEEIARQGE